MRECRRRSRASPAAVCSTASTWPSSTAGCAISRILIVRLDGIGDAAVCAPAIVALRAAGHRLGIALSTRNAGLFAPGVFDETYVLERIPWPAHGSTRETYEPARAAIRAAAYDVALIVSEEPEAYRLAAGITTRVGFWNGFEKPLKSLWVRTQLTRAVHRPASQRLPEHEALTIFRLTKGFAARRTPSRDAAELRALLLERPLPRAGTVAVQLTAKWGAAGVAPATLRSALQRLSRRYDLTGLCAAAERDYAACVTEQTGIVVRPFETLAPWTSALAQAALLLSPDTGAVHVAGMLGTPVVVAYADSPDVALQQRRWAPWAALSRSLVLRPNTAPSEVPAALEREVAALLVADESHD